jgi:PAS domain S-box-containing protein
MTGTGDTDLPYRSFFQSMPCYLTVQDRSFNIVAANDTFKREFGDRVGEPCYTLYKRLEAPCERCPVKRTFDDGRCHRSEQVVTRSDGSEITVIAFTSPIRDEQGDIVSVEEISADITEVKKLQQMHQQSKERYRLLFEEVPCYITIQDRDLRITEANRSFEQDFGSFEGRRCYEAYKHRSEECIPCSVQKTFVDGKVHRSEEVVTSTRGEPLNVLVYTAPLYDADGRIRHVMEMSTNITPIRQLQSQLESIGMLISSVSHGIKGLLTGLDGGMYLVNSGMEKNNPQRLKKGWEMVQRNVDGIRSTVLNILYYAKEREPSWEVVSASDLVEEVYSIVEPRAREHRVVLRRAEEAGVGAVEGDPAALRSLLVNLAENSIDACRVDRSKTELEVTLGLKGDPGHVQFEVADNGIGMDRETREKAFSLFFSSKGVEGTGLGLFIANKIAKAHGGVIELESESGKGTRFSVRIPRKRGEELGDG